MNDFEIFLEKYMKSYCLPRDDALKHALVREVKRYYENREGGTLCEP